MPTPPQSRFRVPHWGWFLLATVMLVVGYFGLSVWLPWHREQQVIQRNVSWSGWIYTETTGPEWLRQLVGKDRMKEFNVFERVVMVHLEGPAITDAEVAHLSRLTNLVVIDLSHSAVTDLGLGHLSKSTKLQYLYLTDTAVTDAGLARLSGLKNLKLLICNGAVVTRKGLEELQKALPRCEIHP